MYKYKRIVGVICIIPFLLYCSGDDSNNTDPEKLFTVKLEEVCNDPAIEYCVDKKEYDKAHDYYVSEIANSPCIWLTITDINNQKHSGYYKGGRSNCN